MSKASERADELAKLLAEQVRFTEALRRVAIEALAYAGHINAHYAKDVPDDLLRAMTRRQVEFSAISLAPSPVTRGRAN